MRTIRSGARLWLLGVLFNVLLFAPLYFTNRETARLLPAHLTLTNLPASLLWRRNLDPWRINVELVLLGLLLLLWLPARRPRTRRLRAGGALLLYLTIFVYYLYESLARDVFGLEPNAYNQLSLLLGVAQSFRGDFLGLLPSINAASIALAAGALAAFSMLLWLAASFFARLEAVQLRSWMRTAALSAAVLPVLLMGLGWRGAQASHPRAVVSSVSLKLMQNAADSRAAARLMGQFDAEGLARAYDYGAQAHALTNRPNVWLIFIESYGSVLLERADWQRDYATLLHELSHELDAAGWHAASVASEAPTWGGGSWLSYTTLLGGLHVDSHPHYLALLNRYQAEPLPGLVTFLRGQGYRHVQLSTLAKPLPAAEWTKYTNFYGVDEWLRFDDLAYEGTLYGWGPAPPDQYALWFAAERLRAPRAAEQPFVFFFITQNSHYPWSTPPLVEEWRSLNTASPLPAPAFPPSSTSLGKGEAEEDNTDHDTLRANYWLAINYELRLLTRFIREQGTADDLFVLVGDHQPPRISRRDDSLRVPLHVISREPALLEQFEAHGFGRGLAIDEMVAGEAALEKLALASSAPENVVDANVVDANIAFFRHEGFPSLLSRALLAQSDVPTHELPPYLPNGVEQ